MSYSIRRLNEGDIEQIKEMRRLQEVENRGSDDDIGSDYLDIYGESVRKMISENKAIGCGVFNGDKLVSLGFYNLIQQENGKIPYLCAVFTLKEERRKEFAYNIIFNLEREVLKKIEEGENISLNSSLTVEGTEAASGLYIKHNYKTTDKEMSILCRDKEKLDGINDYEIIETDETEEKGIKKAIIRYKEKDVLEILYYENTLFPHPSNISGIMDRIIGIELPNEIHDERSEMELNKFISEHNFCKLNAKNIKINEDLFKSVGFNWSNNVMGKKIGEYIGNIELRPDTFIDYNEAIDEIVELGNKTISKMEKTGQKRSTIFNGKR